MLAFPSSKLSGRGMLFGSWLGWVDDSVIWAYSTSEPDSNSCALLLFVDMAKIRRVQTLQFVSRVLSSSEAASSVNTPRIMDLLVGLFLFFCY